jgi:hypothetical protein
VVGVRLPERGNEKLALAAAEVSSDGLHLR